MRFSILLFTALISTLLSNNAFANSQDKRSCDYVNQWANFKSISVSYSAPESPSKVKFEHTKSNFENLYRITVSDQITLEVDRIPGFTSYRSKDISKATDCFRDLGDTSSYLNGQIVRALYLLGRANFDGPDSFKGKLNIDLTVEKLMEKVIADPGTVMRIPGPWHLTGTLEKIDDKNIVFDFIQKVPGWNDERVKGVWSTERKWQFPLNSEVLSDWKVCKWRSVTSEKNTKNMSTFGELRLMGAKLREDASNQAIKVDEN